MYQLEGGIIEYTRQVKAENLESKFIGKNFVFDSRLGERIIDDIIARCHQCGKPCDNHTNCVNDGCHLLFIQCDDCKEKMENCCSDSCREIIHLPLVEQIKLRKGKDVGNKIFRKGKSPALKFKAPGTLPDAPLAKVLPKKVDQLKKQPAKEYLGSCQHYYSISGIGYFLIENGTIKTGDTLLFKGPTTGKMEVVLNVFFANGQAAETATAGNKITLSVPDRIRKSDKVYKIVSE